MTSSENSRTSSRTRRTSSIVPYPLRIGTGTDDLELITVWAQYVGLALLILSLGTKCRQWKVGDNE